MRRTILNSKKAMWLILAFFLSAIAVTLPVMLPQFQRAVQPIDRLYVFGDSLSDVGNVFRATNGAVPAPPYYQGRHSNGKVWVEELADKLNLSADRVGNFAWGGATTGEVGMNQVPGILAQVQAFLKNQPRLNPQALFVVWAGSNDYLFSTETPTVSIDNLNESLQLLLNQGAKRLLVANLPDLGKLPATRQQENAQRLTNFAIAYNQALKVTLEKLEQPGLAISELDVFHIYQTALNDPNQYGFTNVTNACLETATNCDRFLFWDGIHPTATAHKVLGALAFEQVQREIVDQSART
ncbi:MULTISPECIES: SGNH/GDSL hydrolase family protein [Leptolyngbya]|uniref:SGNH/GDSL hydrolase family protein n=1 Tax=Leptolyngbya TaxID=47251 RepID=UPI001685A5FD|nr:SGNH/GDSL hydrolase family protein [Leptolyngbya sp. FACHB-1624]MBD1858264.1 SGNH/GDSL hydrolase family protein [Leptolyngbya sp. FACHB-1624]